MVGSPLHTEQKKCIHTFNKTTLQLKDKIAAEAKKVRWWESMMFDLEIIQQNGVEDVYF